jgi:hypothetical protein
MAYIQKQMLDLHTKIKKTILYILVEFSIRCLQGDPRSSSVYSALHKEQVTKIL